MRYMLTPTNIIEGAYYAADQAGHLFIDAVALYERKRWPTSLVLAVFCLEEIGKADGLVAVAADVAKGGPETAKEVRRDLTNHLVKLRNARQITITASQGFWGELPGDTTKISQQLENVFRINQENAPREAHGARKKALFVDLLDDESWQRPAETTSNEAYNMLLVARIEYTRCRGIFLNPTVAVVRQALVDLDAVCLTFLRANGKLASPLNSGVMGRRRDWKGSMLRKVSLALCACALFVGGWLTGSAQSQYPLNGASWKPLTDLEKILFVQGFYQGYNSAADLKPVLARKDLTEHQRSVIEEMDHELTGHERSQHITMGQIATTMSTFYSDFRNQAICWAPALVFSMQALNGSPPTEQELNRVREGAVKSRCK